MSKQARHLTIILSLPGKPQRYAKSPAGDKAVKVLMRKVNEWERDNPEGWILIEDYKGRVKYQTRTLQQLRAQA